MGIRVSGRGRRVFPRPSWPGVSRPPAPDRWDRRGGCTTAGAWVAGTRPAMTERADRSPTTAYPDPHGHIPMATPGDNDMAPPVRQRLRRLVSDVPPTMPTLPEMAGSSPAMTETHQPPRTAAHTYRCPHGSMVGAPGISPDWPPAAPAVLQAGGTGWAGSR